MDRFVQAQRIFNKAFALECSDRLTKRWDNTLPAAGLCECRDPYWIYPIYNLHAVVAEMPKGEFTLKQSYFRGLVAELFTFGELDEALRQFWAFEHQARFNNLGQILTLLIDDKMEHFERVDGEDDHPFLQHDFDAVR